MKQGAIACGLAVAALLLCGGSSNLAFAAWIGSIVVGFDLCGRIESRLVPRSGASATARRLPRNERIVVALLVGLSLALSLHDLTHWRWSGTPDEAHFFNAAKSIATGELQPFLFSEHGVFDTHPILSSEYQAVFMRVFGATAFGWRLSSAAAVALAVACLYVLARRLWGAGVATAAALLFATTPLVVGFAHLGYNNTQVYPVVIGSLALIAGAARLERLYLAGFVAGLGFYTFYPARLAPLLALLLGCCLGVFAIRGDGRRRMLAFVCGCVLCIAPALMLLPESLGKVSALTNLGGAPAVIAAHWLKAVLYPVSFENPHHFQWTPVVDPVSGQLCLLGLLLCLASFRNRADRFLAAAYLLSALLVGATSHHERPPLTRLLFLSPFVATLAAVALQRITGVVARRIGRSPARVAAALLIAFAAFWGVIELQYNVRYRYHGCGDGTTSEAVRLASAMPPDAKIVYLQRRGSTMLMVDSVFDQYGMAERLVYGQGFDDEAKRALEEIEPPYIVIDGLEDEDGRKAVAAIVERRFPGRAWEESAPGQPWNLRYSTGR